MNHKLVGDVLLFLFQNGSDIAKGVRNEVDSIRTEVSDRRAAARKKKEVVDQPWPRQKGSPLGLHTGSAVGTNADAQEQAYKPRPQKDEVPRTWLTVPLAVRGRRPEPKVRPAARSGHAKSLIDPAEVRRRAELLADWANKKRNPSQ